MEQKNKKQYTNIKQQLFDLIIISLQQMQQISQYFDRFYKLVIKDNIQDPLIHSQWVYFMSMFKQPSLQRQRLQLYLGILANEKKKKGNDINDNEIFQKKLEYNLKKQEQQQIQKKQIPHKTQMLATSYNNQKYYELNFKTDLIPANKTQLSNFSKTKLKNSEDHLFSNVQIKLQKRYSEAIKPLHNQRNEKQSRQKKRMSSFTEQFKPINDEPYLTFKQKNQNIYCVPTSYSKTQTYKKENGFSFTKDQYQKIRETTQRLVRVFEANVITCRQ